MIENGCWWVKQLFGLLKVFYLSEHIHISIYGFKCELLWTRHPSLYTQNIRRLIGFFRPYRPSCSALVAYDSLILDKAQNWEFPTTWMNMNYWSQKATAGSPERVTKNNVWIIFFDNQPLKPHPYCIKTTTFLRVHMNPLLVINYTVS